MKKFLMLLSAIGALSLTATTATAGDTYYRVVGYDSCGHAVYAYYHVHSYDGYGRPVGQWNYPSGNYASVVNPGPMYRLEGPAYPAYSYQTEDAYKPQPAPNNPYAGWNFQARD